MDIKFKVISMIAGLLLSVSFTVSFINYKKDVQSAKDQLKDVSLPLSVDNIYSEIQHRMIKPLIVSSLMANNTFLIDWILNGEKDIDSIKRYLKEIQEKYSTFTSFVVSDKTKHYYHSKGLIDTINKKNSSDKWYFDFLDQDRLYEVNLDSNDNFGTSLIMFINHKVKDYKDNFIAITGVGIKLENIQQMLQTFKDRYDYDVYFVDKAGEIILHTKGLDKRGNISSIEGLKDLLPKIQSSKSSKHQYSYNKNEYLLHTKFVEELNLYLYVEVNNKKYMDPLGSTLFMNMFISLLVTMVVVFIIRYFINIYQKKLECMAYEDSLTKLDNRRKFNKDTESMFGQYHRGHIESIRLIILDIDDFKQINDTYGHLVGDKVLVRFSEILQENLRNSDFIARWGGEEFAVMIINTLEDDSFELADKLRKSISQDQVLKDLAKREVTASFGIGTLEHNESIDALISKVDDALYKAKESGKNNVVKA